MHVASLILGMLALAGKSALATTHELHKGRTSTEKILIFDLWVLARSFSTVKHRITSTEVNEVPTICVGTLPVAQREAVFADAKTTGSDRIGVAEIDTPLSQALREHEMNSTPAREYKHGTLPIYRTEAGSRSEQLLGHGKLIYQ